MFPGGEDFSDKFAPPMVLFMAEEQVQQLGEHTQGGDRQCAQLDLF